MTRSTGQFVDCNVGGSLDNGDAIVTCANGSFSYSHIVRVANMDTISVGAVCRGTYMKVACPDVLAVSDEQMSPFAIKGSQASY